MTLEEKENNLFNRWRTSINSTEDKFAKDGLANEKIFNNAKYKILFLAKETNDTDKNWDTREYLRRGVFFKSTGKPISATFSNIYRWTNLFLNNLTDYKQFKKVPMHKEKDEIIKGSPRINIFSQIGMMNLKKTTGTHTTNNDELKICIENDNKFINEQISIYKPDIVICCGRGVYNGYKKAMGQVVNENKSNGKFRTSKFISTDYETLLIDFYHPQARVKIDTQYKLLKSIKEQYDL